MVTTKQITNRGEWESFLEKHPEANFLQSFAWGEFHKSLGHKIFRSGFYDKGLLCGVMLSITERARRGTYLTIPAGPIIDLSQKIYANAFIKEIKRIGNENSCAFIRVRPQLLSTPTSIQLFKAFGFKNAPMHLHAELTNQLDITKTENELLSSMRKGTRYEIKKAQKLGIEISESINPDDIEMFYQVQISTAKRQDFVPFSKNFLKTQFKIFAKEKSAVLYSSFFEGKLLSQAFVIFYGKEAVYHYGASTENGREYPGAYLLQWHAIQEAKKRGITRYNFWGVAPSTHHRFSNLSLFKRGFGGMDVEYLHAQDLVLSYPKYLLNLSIEIIRKKVRRV